MILYLQLFWEFFKTGLFAVGGGLATLPFLANIADKTGWFTRELLADMVAVAESTPGPLGVNTAVFAGFTCAGILGAIIAVLGLVTPSIIVIIIVAKVLQAFRDNQYVNTIFMCLRPASLGLITVSMLSVCQVAFLNNEYMDLVSRINWKGIVWAAVLLVCTQCIPKTKKLHPIVWIFASAVMGILVF